MCTRIQIHTQAHAHAHTNTPAIPTRSTLAYLRVTSIYLQQQHRLMLKDRILGVRVFAPACNAAADKTEKEEEG
jgi:hypothetical protein